MVTSSVVANVAVHREIDILNPGCDFSENGHRLTQEKADLKIVVSLRLV